MSQLIIDAIVGCWLGTTAVITFIVIRSRRAGHANPTCNSRLQRK
ncbi:hypothetical protein [Alicyclobacillus sp. SO9]|nr:hypothetical protein [Alicyclobacillus sp. SO9]